MGFTYDFVNAPQLSQVRMLIGDTNILKAICDDDEVNAALYLTSSQGIYASGQAMPIAVSYTVVPLVYSVYRAAALLLDAIATNKVRVSGIVAQILDVKLATSQPENTSKEMRALAKEYRDLASNDGSFAIAEMVNNQFSARERVTKVYQRLYGNS